MSSTIYCTAPFNGLTIREDGQVRTCCAGDTSLGNLNKISINDVEKSPALLEIQQDLLSNRPSLKNCQSCIHQEQTTGLASLRQYYLRNYPTVDLENLTLKFIDVRWNNTCNLGCLYCNSDFSTIWEKRLGQTRSTIQKPYQDELLKWILDRIDHVEEIMLVGGEPMLMKQNYELFKHLPLSTRISIITNLSYDLEKLPGISDLLRRPAENIIWNVSLENIKEKFEYVRSEASWDQVQKNFLFLKQHWGDNISLGMVYSVFSAFDLAETIEYFDNLGIKKFNLASIYGNDAVNVKNLPANIQNLALEQLKKVQQQHLDFLHPEDRDLYTLQGIDDLIAGLSTQSANNPVSLEKFNEAINWYDRWGKRKFSELWPELDNLIRTSLSTNNTVNSV